MPRDEADEAASLQHASHSQEEVVYQLPPHHQPACSGEDENFEGDTNSTYCEETEGEDEEIVFIVEGNLMKRQQHHSTKKSTPAYHHQASQTSITTFVPASGITNNSESDGYSKRSAALLLILSMALLLGVLAVVVMVFNDSINRSRSSSSSGSSSSSSSSNYVPLHGQNTDPLQISATSAATPTAVPVQKNPVSYETESILPFFSAEDGVAKGLPSASSSKAAMTAGTTATTGDIFTGIIAAAAAVGDATATMVAASPAQIAVNATAPAVSSDNTVNKTSNTNDLSDPLHRRGLRGFFRRLEDRPSTWMDALTRLAVALEEAVDRFEHGGRKEGREEGERLKPTMAKESNVNDEEKVKRDVDGAVTS
ncbi:Hypothetical protein NocV09_07100030 [Nannochloropsis oceanica]